MAYLPVYAFYQMLESKLLNLLSFPFKMLSNMTTSS